MHTTLRSPVNLLVAALALGILADRLLAHGALGINVPLLVALGLAALSWLARSEARPPTGANLWLGAAAMLFALFLAVREDHTLTLLNLGAAGGLLLLLAASFRSEPLHQLSAAQAALRTLVASVELAFAPAPLLLAGAGRLVAGSDRARVLAPVGRGLALAAPVVLVFGGLLAAADSVFAAYVVTALRFQLPFDAEALVAHGAFAGAAAWACGGGLLVALAGQRVLATPLPAEGDTQRLERATPWRPLGFAESVTVLLAVDALFGGFMVIQAAYLFGGLDTLDRTGMTYADYARRGFFELLTVAVLALWLLWGLALLTQRPGARERRAFNAASAAMVALVLGLLASAFQRMTLYQAAYGFTHLRLYTLSFMVWLALVLLLFLAALLRDRPRIFTFGTLATALAYLAALNLCNPDALIVRQNVARYHTTGVLDTAYLSGLSADAAPALAEAIPSLPAELRAPLEDKLAQQREHAAQVWQRSGWSGWHLGRARAEATRPE